jgi:hypothetical protein
MTDQIKDAVLAEIIDTAIQKFSVENEARAREPIFVERASATVLLIRQRDDAGLTRLFRVQVEAVPADPAARYLMEQAA